MTVAASASFRPLQSPRHPSCCARAQRASGRSTALSARGMNWVYRGNRSGVIKSQCTAQHPLPQADNTALQHACSDVRHSNSGMGQQVSHTIQTNKRHSRRIAPTCTASGIPPRISHTQRHHNPTVDLTTHTTTSEFTAQGQAHGRGTRRERRSGGIEELNARRYTRAETQSAVDRAHARQLSGSTTPGRPAQCQRARWEETRGEREDKVKRDPARRRVRGCEERDDRCTDRARGCI